MKSLLQICLILFLASNANASSIMGSSNRNERASKLSPASSNAWRLNQDENGRITNPKFLMKSPYVMAPTVNIGRGVPRTRTRMAGEKFIAGKGVAIIDPPIYDPTYYYKSKSGASKKGPSLKSSKARSKKEVIKIIKIKTLKPIPVDVETAPPSISFVPTQAPVTPAPATPAPTEIAPTDPGFSLSPTVNDFPVVVLQTYEVLYTIEQSRFLLPSEFEETANFTAAYVNDEFFDAFLANPAANLRSTETVMIDQDFSFGDPVVIVYETTLTFTQDSVVPSEQDLNTVLESFFVPPNDEVYRMFLVDSLNQCCDTNLFTTTSVIGFRFFQPSNERNPRNPRNPSVNIGDSPGTTETSTLFSGGEDTLLFAFAGAGAGLVAFVMVLCGLNAYDRRKQYQRNLVTGELLGKGDGQTIGGETEAETTTGDISSSWDAMTSSSHRTPKVDHRHPSQRQPNRRATTKRAASPSYSTASSEMSPLHHDEDETTSENDVLRQPNERYSRIDDHDANRYTDDDGSFHDEPLDDTCYENGRLGADSRSPIINT